MILILIVAFLLGAAGHKAAGAAMPRNPGLAVGAVSNQAVGFPI